MILYLGSSRVLKLSNQHKLINHNQWLSQFSCSFYKYFALVQKQNNLGAGIGNGSDEHRKNRKTVKIQYITLTQLS